MNRVQDIEEAISMLTPPEKVQVLRTIVRDLGEAFPGIVKTPGVGGGAARIVRTRIPVWLLEHARRMGTSEADLLASYPSLMPDDLVNAWAYVRVYSNEIDDLIGRNEAA